MDGGVEAVVVSQLAEWFYILLSLRGTNTQQRGEERLRTAKLFSQLSQQVASFLCMQIKYNIHLTAHTHTETHRFIARLLPSLSPGAFNYVGIHGSSSSDTEKMMKNNVFLWGWVFTVRNQNIIKHFIQ